MKDFHTVRLMALMLVSFLPGLLAMPPATLAKRGQSPECQEECLRKHTVKMHGLAKKYRNTGDRLDYQNEVNRLVVEYRTCIENCSEPYPVK